VRIKIISATVDFVKTKTAQERAKGGNASKSAVAAKSSDDHSTQLDKSISLFRPIPSLNKETSGEVGGVGGIE